MFQHIQSILVVSRKKLSLSQVDTGGTPHVVQETSLTWNDRNIHEVLKQLISEHSTSSIRVLFDVGACYEMDVTVPGGTAGEKNRVFDELQNMIPEQFEISDCRMIESSRTDSEVQYTTCVPLMFVWNSIRKTMDELRVEIESRASATTAKSIHDNPVIGLALQKKSDFQMTYVPKHKIHHDDSSNDDRSLKSAQIDKPSTHPSSKRPALYLLAIVLLVLIAGMTYVLLYPTPMKSETNIAEGTTPTIVPTMTPEPTIIRSDYLIQVLNGTGIAGEAGRVEEDLKAAGFIQIEIGNAEASDQGTNIIRVKDATASAILINSIKEILTDYKFDAVDSSFEDDNFDLQLLVGDKIL